LPLDPARFDESRGVPLLAWLKRVVANRAVDHIRRIRRKPVHVPLSQVGQIGEKADDPDQRTAMGEAIASVFVDLSENERQILIWHANAIPYDQLATWTGRSVVSLRQVVSRAKGRIRKRLEAQFQKGGHARSYQVRKRRSWEASCEQD